MLSSRNNIGDGNPIAYDWFSIVILFFLALLLMLRQITASRYFTVIGEDAFYYSSWAWQFNEALKEGTFYPRWLPLNFWGYGSPTFLLYPPLAYYLVAIFNLFSDSIIQAMNMTKLVALFLSGTGMYFLVKEFYPARVALLSAIFCLLLPYSIFSTYIYGSFAAIVSSVWFAPLILFVHRYSKSGAYSYLLYSGICYGGLIMTHLITAYMFTFVLVAYAVFLLITGKRMRDILIVPMTIIIGFSLSAMYIIPVIQERHYLYVSTFLTDANYVYSNTFLLPKMTDRVAQGSFWTVYYNTMVWHTVIFCLFIAIFLLRSSKLKGNEHTGNTAVTANRLFLFTAFCSILFLFGISSFIWEIIPFFKYILSPTRWLQITAFSTSFLSASAFITVNYVNRASIKSCIWPALLFLSCITLDIYFIRGAPGYGNDELLPPVAVNEILEHLPNGVQFDKINKSNTTDTDTAKFTIQGEGSARVISWKSSERAVDISAEQPVAVRFRLFNFPGWNASVDGKQVEIVEEPGTRAILVNVPKGNHRLELVFKDTPARLCGKWISLGSLLLLSALLIKVAGRR